MHPHQLDADDAFLLVVDFQECYRPVLHAWERTEARLRILVEGARAIGIPVAYTEQYPKGMGPTAPEVARTLEGAPRFEKRSLSALGAEGLAEHLAEHGRRHAVVAGIETHACISQTVHALLERGHTVHLPVDALSSRHPFDHEQALEKMKRAGALPGSVEMLLLELVRTADHPRFKDVQKLLK